MTIIPLQSWGIGDIIFTQTLVHRIADGRPIVWPVLQHFVEGLNRAYPHITFVDQQTFQIDYDRKDQYEFEHPKLGRCTVLPLRWSDVILKVPYNDCMRAKYDLYGMDFEDWREHAKWLRDGLKELELNKMQHLQKEQPYTFVNGIFGSECRLTVKIPENEGAQVFMTVKPGYSLFDWQTLIQNSSCIHTVNTSIIYLLEMLDLKAPEIHLYQRSIPGQTFDNISYLLKKHRYVFHG